MYKNNNVVTKHQRLDGHSTEEKDKRNKKLRRMKKN